MAWINKEERKCKDCGGTEFIEDHTQGDMICQVYNQILLS